MNINQVAGENLYISGVFALEGCAPKEAGITHIVSVLEDPVDKSLIENYEHMFIKADDESDENLLKHFTASNEFISKALQSGGAVLIHCVMGISRSATILAAYLMATRQIAPKLALGLIKCARPMVEPNPGFMKQLELYYEMGYAAVVEEHPVYQRWIYLEDVSMT